MSLSLFFVFGAVLGSFANAWIWRTRNRIPIYYGRSMCPDCRHQIAWYQNIPIISFIILRGRCHSCHNRISWQYPLVELWMGIAFAFVAYTYFFQNNAIFSAEIIRDLMVVFFLTIIFLYDLYHGEILDRFTLIPSAILYLASLYFHWESWQSLLAGIIIGGGFFLAQFVLSKGKWIGGGDIRLGIFMGVILGWPRILVALFFAYILGALVSVVLIMLKKKKLADATPFGTYLTVGTLISMLWGNSILQWYMNLIK